MGSAFFQTTLFWVFTLNYWLKLDYLSTPNNLRRHGKDSIKSKWICFLIQNQEKNLFENTHSNGSWSENTSSLCLFCDSTFREKAIWEDT